jgi:hypothetical protein
VSVDEAHDGFKDGLATLAMGRRLASGVAAPDAMGGGRQNVSTEAGTVAQVPALRSNLDEVAKRDEAIERKRELPEKSDLNAAFKSAQSNENPVAEQVVAAAGAKDEPQREARFAKAAARPAPVQPDAKAPSTQPTAIAATDPRGMNDPVNGKFGAPASGTSAPVGGGLVLKQQQVQLRGVQQLADDAGAAGVVLSCNLNGQQVSDLARSLSQPERNIYARVQLERSDPYRQTKLGTLDRSSDQKNKEGLLSYERQPVEEHELMLREKVVAANAPAVVGPTTRPTEGTLAIKAAEAGLTRADSEAAARLDTAAPNAVPGDFAFQANQQQQVPAQQQGFFVIAPTTQPLSARGTKDLYTCVIVVQTPTANRAGTPTTQPVAGKPATAPAAAQPDNAK